ncbi:MAG TPA: phosphatidate cytidylyltransferase [Xanthomonadaceae bacterium]|nr:phosphatidate cytidylyltransferase [Xanthomonadaceae bacterium]
MSAKQRIVTTVVLTPLVVGAMFLPTPYVAAIAAGIFVFGLWEWSRLVGIDEPLSRALYVLANIALMTALPWGHGLPLFGPVCLIGVVWWLVALLWLLRPDVGRDGGWWSRSIKLAAGTLSIVPAWCALVLLHHGSSMATHTDPNGPRWALLGLVMIWVADSFAYFFGVRYGKRKLVPDISPGKTWVGLWGGVIGALAVGLAGAQFVGVKQAQLPSMAALALLTVTASVVGDLFESLMKRHSGYKDSGTLIPGHGGVLDRVDSLLAALPVLWIAKGWLEL